MGAASSLRNLLWIMCGILPSSLLVNHLYPHPCLVCGHQSISPRSHHNAQSICVSLLLLFSLSEHVRLFCDPMDCSPSGSSVHGILQARTLGWVAISSSRGSSRPLLPQCLVCWSEAWAHSAPGRLLTHLGFALWTLADFFISKIILGQKRQKQKIGVYHQYGIIAESSTPIPACSFDFFCDK